MKHIVKLNMNPTANTTRTPLKTMARTANPTNNLTYLQKKALPSSYDIQQRLFMHMTTTNKHERRHLHIDEISFSQYQFLIFKFVVPKTKLPFRVGVKNTVVKKSKTVLCAYQTLTRVIQHHLLIVNVQLWPGRPTLHDFKK